MKFDRNLRAKILAGIVALIGLLNISSSAFFPITNRLSWLQQVLPPEVTFGSRSLTLVTGFLLIGIAWSLAQRRLMAWLLTSWLLIISAFSHILKGLDVEEALIALVLLGILLIYKSDFTVRSDPGAIQDVFFSAPYALLFFFAYSILGFYFLKHQLLPVFSIDCAIRETVNLATFQGDKIFKPLTGHARWFFESVTFLSGVAAAYIVYSLMRPILRPAKVTHRDRKAAREIIHEYGYSGIAYFALGSDKSYFFNYDSTCIIPYVLVRNVAISAGDPVGPPDKIISTIEDFKEFCEENNWISAFYQVQEENIDYYKSVGFGNLKIGEEAIMEVQEFDLKGKAKQELRSGMNRAKKEGWQFFFYRGPVEDEKMIEKIEAISESWLANKSAGEMGFTMGGVPIGGSDETLVCIATDSQGDVLGFLTWAPMFSAKGWSLDSMRRTDNAPNGLMEFLIVSSINKMKERGDNVASLGLAPLANVQTENPETLLSLEKGIEVIYENINTVYHFKSLHRFKKKFAPRWESRHLIFPGLPVFPSVIHALVKAQVPNFSLIEMAKKMKS
ncbi:MAG: phosphatidylglycerol lysyltransferase domain-containing protein [Candidatus Eremiobacteraeota bacterium]|nr:phosphatidylglycerol lysyltransferase domain-containing protein [Candidatus Eremiobacteraeota bacterium]